MQAQHKVTAASFAFYPKQENRLAFARLRVALDEWKGSRENAENKIATHFVTVLADGNVAERMNEELRKGAFLQIEGEWQTRNTFYQGEPREERIFKLADFKILSHSKAVKAELAAAQVAASVDAKPVKAKKSKKSA